MVRKQSEPQPSDALDGTHWQVEEIRGQAVVADKKPEIKFGEQGFLGARGGCNRFSGSAEITGNTIAFSDKMAGTLMACPPPLDTLEKDFLEALQNVTEYQLSDDSLVLTDASGPAVMHLSRHP